MSLLLEALKKAEKAKEDAQRQAGNPASSPVELQLETAEPPESKHVFTKDELPSISQQMEITSEGLGNGGAAEQGRAQPAPRAQRATAFEPQPAERAAAKKVFEAKFKEPNPKLPFYIVMGILGAFAVGTVAYFWYQLRPPPPLVNPDPPRGAAEQPVALPGQKPAPVSAPGATPAPPQAEIPGLPGGKPASALPSLAPAAPAAVAPSAPLPTPTAKSPAPPPSATAATVPPSRQTTPTRPESPASAATTRQQRAPVAVRKAAPSIDPLVSNAYQAYQTGDFTAARSGYERALGADPSNRDALLGLAAVEMRAQNLAAAETLYQRLLRADPRDPHAQAGLMTLRGRTTDPVAAESRMKSMLASDPDSGALHFTLANQYAEQGRWAEAQQAYFKALNAEPDNPDFAYNLAVSLDHLRQPKLALDYYRRALSLSERRGAAFDRSAAQLRAQELSR